MDCRRHRDSLTSPGSPSGLLLNLLQLSIFPDLKPPQFPRSIAPDIWTDTFNLARRHSVDALAFSALPSLPQSLLPPHELLLRWSAVDFMTRQANAASDAALHSILAFYSSKGFSPVLLKGRALAALYPDPASRTPGDIDLWMPKSAPLPPGAVPRRRSDGSHSFIHHGVEIELHSTPFDIHTPSRARELLKDISIRTLRIDDQFVNTLSPEFNILMQSAHIFKHAIGHGIGLRQFCDFAISLRAFASDINAQTIRHITDRAGLSRWMPLLCSAVVFHLGLPQQYLPYPMPLSHRRGFRLICHALHDGNFGRSNRFGDAVGTCLNLLRRSPFALSTAPSEALNFYKTLIHGRIHR